MSDETRPEQEELCQIMGPARGLNFGLNFGLNWSHLVPIFDLKLAPKVPQETSELKLDPSVVEYV